MMCIILLTQVLRNRIKREKKQSVLSVSQDFAMYVCVFLKIFINEIIQMFLCFAKISIFYNTDTCACKDLEIVSFSGFPSSFTGFDKPHVLILIIRIFGKNIQSYFTISAANDMSLFLA